MPDSIRQQIMAAVDARFKTILKIGGYGTDLGLNIFAWKAIPFSDNEIDGLSYKDRTEARTPGVGIYELILPVEITIVSTSPTQMRKCRADLEKAIFVDETWGGLALNTEIETSEMEVEQKENLYVASGIIMPIEYRTVRGDPDTQA